MFTDVGRKGASVAIAVVLALIAVLVLVEAARAGDGGERLSQNLQTAPDKCLALASADPWHRHAQASSAFAGVEPVNLKPYQIRLTFIGHATFLIESPKGIRAATDYSLPIAPPLTPDIVTMNNSHTSHWTPFPQPEIGHVLKGWADDDGTPRLHDVTVEDLRVRNVPTNTRDWSGGGTRFHGNSIFVFEVAGFCIAHLGHLHHTLTPQQLANIGQMDVVLVPVDGSYTLDHPGMFEVLKAMNPRYIVPMHYFTRFTLERFLTEARKIWTVRELEVPTAVLSKDQMPSKPEVMVLPGN